MTSGWEWDRETGLPGFLAATIDQARRVLHAEEDHHTYEAGAYFSGLAAAGMSGAFNDELSEISRNQWLIWGELTDAMDAPGTGSPERDAAAVRQMKRASAEWLQVVDSPKERAAYLDRWVHDECGYARKPS
ncbi:hypothetical protein [Actinoplanes sp. URMC 104]|uniref:hypothetical protein n=1 Tax=Actinoplanes sp. URMC 104 TaxID=3423409 RepID=UPI003F1CCF65